MSLPVENTDLTFGQVITGRVPFSSVPRHETVMFKVVKGDRPDRPPSLFSEKLWDLLVATWVTQYAQKPRKRPPVSTVLTRLKECVGHWRKSDVPPKDWENTSLYRMFLNDCGGLLMPPSQVMKTVSRLWQVIFSIKLVILPLTRGLNDLAALEQASQFPHRVGSTVRP